MGLFGTSTNDSIVEEVEKATNENNTEEDWDKIINICDKAGKSTENAKAYLKAIIRRLNNTDPHIAVHAVTLLDACVKNSGKLFHIEVASRDFETEFTRLLSKKNNVVVSRKLRESLKRWAENEFKMDPQLNLIPSLYSKLRNSGVDFSVDTPVKKTAPVSKDPNVVESQEEENQILKAIEMSLKESHASPRSSAPTTASLYPSTSLQATTTVSSNSTPVKDPKKVRALYDFEAAEDNELTFKSGEIIFVTDDSDANWWKGSNQRGEGLFPANFVTNDLNVEPEQFLYEKAKKSVQFKETIDVQAVKDEPEEVELNEDKIDRLMHLLHEADPTNSDRDSEEMLKLEREVNAMGPLIDYELERVDRKHAQLTQLSADLVEALGLYHTLMREPVYAPAPKMPYNYNPQAGYNGLPHHPMGPHPSMGPNHPQDGRYVNPHFASMPMPQQPMSLPPHLLQHNSFGPPNMIPPNFPPMNSGSQTVIHNGPPQPQQQQGPQQPHYMQAPE